ncbi:MAG: hypothetical protein C1O27_002265 [Chloroflexi bacterium]|jgi:hypothetical protein|nr:MAG: hypothetical protein C1O27_002265 [Chloroflexota bacterium]
MAFIADNHPIYAALREAFPDTPITALKGAASACRRLGYHSLADVANAPDEVLRGHDSRIGKVRYKQLRAIAPANYLKPAPTTLTGFLLRLLGHDIIVNQPGDVRGLEYEGVLKDVGTDYLLIMEIQPANTPDLEPRADLVLTAPFNVRHEYEGCVRCDDLADYPPAVSHETAGGAL